MIVLKGIGASPGVSIGRAYVLEDEELVVTRLDVARGMRPGEVRRFRAAQKATYLDLDAAEAKVLKLLGKTHAKLIDAHRLILKDPLIVREVPQRIMREGVNAEFALSETMEAVNKQFEKMDDEFFRERRHDLLDVGRRLLGHLMKLTHKSLSDATSGSIVVAKNILPSEALGLQDAKIMGFATDLGGKSSHTAILAQSLELPAVVGLSNASRSVKTGDAVILDGEQGVVIVNPSPETVARYRRVQQAEEETKKELLGLRGLPATTLDGRTFGLEANLDSLEDIKGVAALNPDGIGLFRTESLFLNRTEPPGEREQTDAYAEVLKAFEPKPVVIRIADLGGDRMAQLGLEAPKSEANPFLGLRGIRLFLRHPDVLKTQLRAILRAAAGKDVKILFPMISSAEEIRGARDILQRAQDELKALGVPATKSLKVGIMVEVPSAALLLDAFLPLVDFVSIGTNDLIQYVLAVDRINDYVAQLYDPFHPAVVRILDIIVKAAHRQNKPVSLCGGMGSDPQAVPLAAGLGVDSLSVSPRLFLRVKQTLRGLRYDAVAAAVGKALSCIESEGVRRAITEAAPFLSSRAPGE
ncbi:MAG TPA: phosphoenolpyruvate--protein phosphotransferase [Elusimicrobiota bacterium]|nr:phosphoenolpyruvate--protein phosphotransferase [Elusimicrobiota bacterium]